MYNVVAWTGTYIITFQCIPFRTNLWYQLVHTTSWSALSAWSLNFSLSVMVLPWNTSRTAESPSHSYFSFLPIQSLHSEWVSHTSPLYAYDISPHMLASTPLHLSIVYILWVYSCLFQFQSLLQLSHSIIYYHQTVYSFNYIILHRSSCSTLRHSIWNKQYTS